MEDKKNHSRFRSAAVCVLSLILAWPICSAKAEDALEVIATAGDEMLPILNESLRRTSRRIRALEDGININTATTGTLTIGRGGTGAALTDPGADRILFWDDSDGESDWLELGSGLTISGNTLTGSSVEVYASSGTFTAPAGVTRVFVTMVAGGGGGGRDNADDSGGGGGGGWVLNYPYTVTPGNDYTVTVGAGGTGRTGSNGAGTAGGASSFDALSVAGGGAGSDIAAGAGGAAVNNLNASGSTAGGKVVTFAGGDGGISTATNGGGGGGTPVGVGASGGTTAGNSASANTGGGGQAGRSNGNGGDGGSGIVIISF